VLLLPRRHTTLPVMCLSRMNCLWRSYAFTRRCCRAKTSFLTPVKDAIATLTLTTCNLPQFRRRYDRASISHAIALWSPLLPLEAISFSTSAKDAIAASALIAKNSAKNSLCRSKRSHSAKDAIAASALTTNNLPWSRRRHGCSATALAFLTLELPSL
jgi:hypothetical protein